MPDPRLPSIDDDAAITRLTRDDAACLAVVRTFARELGVVGDVERIGKGSLPIGGVGDVIVKVFPPPVRSHARTELRVLGFLDGRLPVPTPRLLGSHEHEGWTAVAMARLQGRPFAECKAELTDHERLELIREVGALSAGLHALDASPVFDLPPTWDTFIEQQRTTATDRQRARGLEELWLRQIDPFLTKTAARRTKRTGPHVLLHTELMLDHLFVDRSDDGRWHLSGLLDFEPAMVGPREYEWASVGLFVALGEPAAFAAYFDGYGIAQDARTPALFEDVMAHVLLHRYANLPWYIERLGARGATTFSQLAQLWFGPPD